MSTSPTDGPVTLRTQAGELSFLHSRDVTYATLCQAPFEESVRYRDSMCWDAPWYSAQRSLGALLVGRRHCARSREAGGAAIAVAGSDVRRR